MWPWIARGAIFIGSWVIGDKVQEFTLDQIKKRLIDYSAKWKIYSMTKTDKINDARLIVSNVLKRSNKGEPAAMMENGIKWYTAQHPDKGWRWVKIDYEKKTARIYPKDRVANFEIMGEVDDIDDFIIFPPKIL